MECWLKQTSTLNECDEIASRLEQKLREQSAELDQFCFDDETEDYLNLQTDLAKEKADLEERVRMLESKQVSGGDMDDIQVQRALMPLLESLVDPSDQIIVQDKQGRTFKIAFCEYQSEETDLL